MYFYAADVLITCDGHKSIKHLVLDNPIIECHPSSRSTPNNHCYDPDDNIVFEIEDDPSGIFSVEINSTYYCLKADPGLVNAPVACVSIQKAIRPKFSSFKHNSFNFENIS